MKGTKDGNSDRPIFSIISLILSYFRIFFSALILKHGEPTFFF
jgi:hypothetical protein